MSKHKWLTIIGIVVMFFVITGCSGTKSTQDKNSANTGTESKEATNKLESDADLTKQLEAEKGIEKVMVQVVEGQQRAVNVDIEINNEQTLTADEVVKKYSEVIKKKYLDSTIDILVAKDGKMLKQVKLPK